MRKKSHTHNQKLKQEFDLEDLMKINKLKK